MKENRKYRKINVLDGLEKVEDKEKEIINLNKEIGIDEKPDDVVEDEFVIEEESSEADNIKEEMVDKISKENNLEEMAHTEKYFEKNIYDSPIDNHLELNKKKKFDGRLLLICILFASLGIAIYACFNLFSQYQRQEKLDEDSGREVENIDTASPEFVGYYDQIVINLNAVQVDYSKYYLAVDNNQQIQVVVKGDINLSQEGEYPITVSATDEFGNVTTRDAIVKVISEETMVAIPLELTPMIDGSIPLATDTKMRVDANVITFYYGEVSQEIKDELARLGIDVSIYHLDSYWHPDDLNRLYYN